jgi:fibronectin type 3 domain-containing protein
VAGPPTRLAAEASQDAITLTWDRPQNNIDGSPASILGYNVYRSNSVNEPAKLLNSSPTTDTRFDDRFFEFKKPYYYFVRAVSSGTESEPVEGAESNIVRFSADDKFAPAPPSAITIAAAPNTISIFWAVNLETDVVGYTVYRTEDHNKPLAEWTVVTPELLKTNTFQDTRVEPGKTYYYYLTATDKFGNISGSSEVVSETVP